MLDTDRLIIAGLLLILLGQVWLWVAREYSKPGRHALSRLHRHDGWEGREDELRRFTAAFLIEKHATPRWPLSDPDTEEFPIVRVGESTGRHHLVEVGA
jgi:hypothetical protein